MLVDTFMFYNELDVLELRLEVLDRYVDRFVLVESEVNHKGEPKELFFQNNRQRYAKWLPKITHIIVTTEESPKDQDPWCREKYQRESILRGVQDVPNESIVMVSDVDEIPDLARIPFEKLPHILNSVHMWMFEYSLEYIFTGEPWFGTVITTAELFRRVGPNALRDGRWKFPCMQYAGWHLTSFGDAKHVANKHRTFAHCNDKREHAMTEQTFDFFIKQGLHTDGHTPLIPRPPEVPLPAPLEVLQRLKFI